MAKTIEYVNFEDKIIRRETVTEIKEYEISKKARMESIDKSIEEFKQQIAELEDEKIKLESAKEAAVNTTAELE